MTRKIMTLSAFALIALIIVGCGSSTTPTPAPTQVPQVVTVVITTTPAPTATLPPPTLAPTVVITPTTVAVTGTVAKPIAAGTPKPAATKKPTVVAVVPTATALPLKFGAPSLIEPISEKDERRFPGQALVFKWNQVGSLQANECYLLSVVVEPINPGPSSRSDAFMMNCGDQPVQSGLTSFTLNQPNQPGPNYSALLPDGSDFWVNWTITVVKNTNVCVDKFHCKTLPISPASNKVRFLLRG